MSTSKSAPTARRFRDTMGLFATGVAVVITEVDGEAHGMTVSSVASVSLDPLMVRFCPGKQTRMAQYVERLSGFTINVLRHEQQALSTYFAGGWRENEPPPYRLVPSRSAPRLEGCLASLDCTKQQIIEAGDHW